MINVRFMKSYRTPNSLKVDNENFTVLTQQKRCVDHFQRAGYSVLNRARKCPQI